MYCAQCGQLVKEGSKFCGACGAPAKSTAAAPAPPPPVTPLPSASPPPPAFRPSPTPPMSDPFDASGQPEGRSSNASALKVPVVIILVVLLAGLVLWLKKGRDEGPMYNDIVVPDAVEEVPAVPDAIPVEPVPSPFDAPAGVPPAATPSTTDDVPE